MMSRDLIDRVIDGKGISYRAGELSETFLNSVTTSYLTELRLRAAWVVDIFGNMNETELRQVTRKFFDNWIEEFHAVQQSLGA